MRIGETLIDSGVISHQELDAALKDQKRTHDRIGDILIRLGFLTSNELAPILAQYFNIPFIDLKDIYKSLKPKVIDLVPHDLAKRFQVIPIDKKQQTLTVAMYDPLNLLAIDTLRIKTGLKIEAVIAPEEDIKVAIDYCYHHLPRMQKHIDKFIDTEINLEPLIDKDSLKVEYAADDQPVVQFVKSLVIQAMNSRVSDIHLQPKQEHAELRFRIDGVLYHIDPPPKSMLAAINTRIKILAGLDIAEKRLPQDGRFKMQLEDHEVDIRVSSFPTIYVESVVMRLLNTSAPLLGLNELGLRKQECDQYRKLINRPYGLILVTGPTGSGKTTTLYTSLNEIKSDHKNIITLEDPVEYRLPFIQQSQVNNQIGFDFAKGLRSILRQDPDVIMVGEVRDHVTAEIAIHAALTGHLVFTTLHTNDACGAPVRLNKMGVESFLITSSPLCVVAQRLTRTVCPHCRTAFPITEETRQLAGLDDAIQEIYKGTGCQKCLNSGYLGRKGIYEMLIPNDEVRALILAQRSSDEIKNAAKKIGLKTMRDTAMDYLREGITTLEEVLRVTQDTEEFI
ncbi:MAG: Flp pilus assembly complex ATPase component TadA [Candidatus Omnitrophica bacterium]|nr:Flp pilus assembly complex ATPase component TadA [Candidatus Omnitrophota bacterium]